VVQTTPSDQTIPTESTARAKTKPKAGAKGKRKRTTTNETAENPEGAAVSESVDAPAVKKRRKKKAAGSAAQDGEDPAGEGTTTKPRNPRAPRKRKNAQDGQDGKNGENGEDAVSQPKRKRAKKAKSTNTEGEDVAEGTEPKRKGRQRATTPSDAEDHEIDPSTALMWDLARHDVRFGKVSGRERHMRELNWEEIKERRKERERDMAMAGTRNNAAVDPRLAEAEAAMNAAGAPGAPGMRLNAEGEIVVDETTTNRDAYADADREAEALEVVEEDDYTMRITTQTFALQNKRDPADRIMSGRSKRWTTEATDQFYDALSMFGTDFMMISTLFPNTSRLSIKTKFNREEKDNPERIKQALLGERTADWNQYLQLANVKPDDFIDPDKLNAELKEEEAQMRIVIDRATADKAEERRQKKLAGFPDSEEEGEEGKENGKKKKKKRDRKKPFEFAPEEGVEVLEDIPEEVVIEEELYGGYDEGGYDEGYDDDAY
jgi:transcription factor TFIIIB component B''